jgi:hypothetical protein
MRGQNINDILVAAREAHTDCAATPLLRRLTIEATIEL